MMPALPAMPHGSSRQAGMKGEDNTVPASPAAPAQSSPAKAGERFPQMLRATREEAGRKPEREASATGQVGGARLDSTPAAARQHEKKDSESAEATLPAMLDSSALAVSVLAANAESNSAAPAEAKATAAAEQLAAVQTPAAASVTAMVTATASSVIAADGQSASGPQGPAAVVAVGDAGLRLPAPLAAAAPASRTAAAASLPAQRVASIKETTAAATPATAARGTEAGHLPEGESAPGIVQRFVSGAAFVPMTVGALATADATPASSATALKLNGAPPHWQQPLREALGERLQVQLGNNSERAVIRLDPPMLGSIEISIRHQAGALQVHMSASNAEVLRQLQTIGDGLRQDLAQRQVGEVTVAVSQSAHARHGDSDSAGRQRPGQFEPEEQAPGRALQEAELDGAAFALMNDRG